MKTVSHVTELGNSLCCPAVTVRYTAYTYIYNYC